MAVRMNEAALKAEKAARNVPAEKTAVPDDPYALTRIDRASIAADSHRGLVRRNNEDNFFYALDSDGSRVIAAVADGIGGNENGEIASRLVCKMLLMRWRRLISSTEKTASREAADFLERSIMEINDAIYKINDSYGSKPMGTTLAVIIISDDWVVAAHCGDSRFYRLRNGELKLLTTDHSLVNELIRCGELTQTEAKTHPYAHVITRSVGPAEHAEPEIHIHDRQFGDRYLLCSDGLTLHVGGDEIRGTLFDAFEPSQAVRRLMHLVLQRGARDNTTMISVFA